MQADTKTATIVSCIIIVIMMAWLGRCTVDAVVQTAEIQGQHYGRPVTFTYSRPAAYRLASPTTDQMDSLHHIQQVAGVR